MRKLPRTSYVSRSLFSRHVKLIKRDRSKIRAVTVTQGVRIFTLRDWGKNIERNRSRELGLVISLVMI